MATILAGESDRICRGLFFGAMFIFKYKIYIDL